MTDDFEIELADDLVEIIVRLEEENRELRRYHDFLKTAVKESPHDWFKREYEALRESTDRNRTSKMG
jgi:hypothetical protein